MSKESLTKSPPKLDKKGVDRIVRPARPRGVSGWVRKSQPTFETLDVAGRKYFTFGYGYL